MLPGPVPPHSKACRQPSCQGQPCLAACLPHNPDRLKPCLPAAPCVMPSGSGWPRLLTGGCPMWVRWYHSSPVCSQGDRVRQPGARQMRVGRRQARHACINLLPRAPCSHCQPAYRSIPTRPASSPSRLARTSPSSTRTPPPPHMPQLHARTPPPTWQSAKLRQKAETAGEQRVAR